ncbi:MAG: hypothetical protein QOH86_189 [Sphingomonadales bacterium]|jgi:hypothetical protein|nr:hypothetical protein [Sphingomonadales bacterium]
MPRLLVATFAACGLAACATPVEQRTLPPPAARQIAERSDCTAAAFPDDRFISEAFTDRFNGSYYHESRQLDVRREAQRLFVGPPGGPRRQLQRVTDIPGEGAFRDRCGVAYRFVLPPDGPGGYVTLTEPNGARTEWHRR